ncbi:hypothetical protein H6785_01180 [Candidatus Nomurabacteria bacterium]|nr:hypothetical protein [Candidatus Kaiserbacteria bacterium]MCB9815183.1 hypothetical protein [Candidatus Nomurabacteria bacterium]
MKPLQTQEQIDEMRRRLYDRGTALDHVKRHELSDKKVDVSRDWSSSSPNMRSNEPDPLKNVVVTENETLEEPVKPKRHYRSIILGVSVFIFAIVAIVSTLFLYFGGNQISNDNIQVSLSGPQFVGGGEIMSLQVTVDNKNSVPIQSATLILKYPEGTRSVGETPKNLYEERIPISDIAAGEVQTIPIQIAVFGEESTDKQIQTTIEYRVNGSNGMFYKDAEPLAFKISSSPLVLRIDNIEKVASGQVVDITITAVSNAPTPLTDLVISASYPTGFIFEKSDPAPVYGQNVWHIDKILPEEEVSIKLQGVTTGLTEETFRINFAIGPADPNNQYLVGANLAQGRADFTIERPFINVGISIDGKTGQVAVLPEGKSSSVKVDITNTLDETVYDMAVEVIPGGNALTEDSIIGGNGFYDSNRGTVRWEVSNNSSFDKVSPGDSRPLSFTVKPGPNRTTASYDLVVNVYARRVAETSAVETLIGTARAEAKYSATVKLGSQAASKSGPVPPKVGETSVYTITIAAEAGANDTANGVVETSLPLNIDWLNSYQAEGNVSFNTVSKKLQWNVGDIESGKRKELTFDVSIKPSTSQIGNSPVLINSQTIRANDRFTSELLQDSSPAVTTELSKEMGYEEGNGKVVK